MEASDLDSLVLRTANGWLQAGIPAWLVTVARTWGSSPRPPGSLMAMNARGDVAGSVSGGCIEDDLVRRVQRLHGPAGLFIGSRTPAGIALSMMTEVVAAKNGAL